MNTKHTWFRFIIPVVLTLTVLLAAGCDLLTNSDSNSTAADPNTLVLPAGTVSGAANGEYFLVYRGAGGQANLTNENFKRFSVSGGAIPSIQLGLADVEDLLVPSNTVANNNDALFNSGTNYPTITPTVNMVRIQEFYPVGSVTEFSRIIRANQSLKKDDGSGLATTRAGTYVVEWWYVDGPATVTGDFFVANLDMDVDNNNTSFQLQKGWNSIIYLEVTADAFNFSVTTGQEPANLGWHFIRID